MKWNSVKWEVRPGLWVSGNHNWSNNRSAGPGALYCHIIRGQPLPSPHIRNVPPSYMDQFGSVKPNIHILLGLPQMIATSNFQLSMVDTFAVFFSFGFHLLFGEFYPFLFFQQNNRGDLIQFPRVKDNWWWVRWWLGHCVIDFDFLSICSAHPGDKHPTTAIKMWKMLPATNWFTFEKGPNCPVLLHFNHQCRNHHEHWTGVNCQRPKFNISVFYVTATKTLGIQIHPCPHSRWHSPKKRKKKEVQNQAQIWCCTLLHCNALVHSWFCGSMQHLSNTGYQLLDNWT